MSVDKKYCMSSYLAFRYIEDDDKDFYEGMHHENIKEIPREHRYMFINPEEILIDAESMDYLFERYRISDNGIDYLKFMDEVFSIENSSSYLNVFSVANRPYFDPYARLIMAEPLDLDRVRNGEPKYLIRELMAKKYPDIPVPFKNPMPRPVDKYFKDWKGPVRKEFKKNLDMTKYTGNQKWQLWCLERFLNNNEE